MLFQWISRHFKLSSTTTVATKVIFGAVVFCFLLSFSVPVHAQQLAATDLGLNSQVEANIGLPATDIRLVVANIIRVAFGLLGIVFLVLVLYAGFLWMTAGGNDEQIGSAKKMLTNGIIGLVIMLSAYGIVSFVISKLLGAGGNGGGGQDNRTAYVQKSFFGTGGLGTVIKDHYPGRDQTEVPRNTKIIITFSQPVLASSFITDSNQFGVVGDCKNVGKAEFDWDADCDKLKSDVITITRSDTNEVVANAAAIVSGNNGQVDTVVIRPIDTLGSDKVEVAYNVHIGGGVQFDDASNDNPSIFTGHNPPEYKWDFTCSKVLDDKPPQVVNVFPKNNTTEAKNSVIQINFNKPMDPTGLQGGFNASKNINGGIIYLKNNNSTVPEGSFRLLNNYQTLEFTPSKACGINACGGTIFCLPVCDANNQSCKTDSYELLVRAADTISATSFESVPFTGAADASGNALDGNKNGTVQHAGQRNETFDNQKVPDNFFWQFNLKDEIDNTAPFIQQATPGPNAEYVSAANELSLKFSKTMNVGSMYSISIEESPSVGTPLWHRPLMSLDNSKVSLQHRQFLVDSRSDYFPVVTSSVLDAHFNCFYPGIGPTKLDSTLENSTKASTVCNGTDAINCCKATNDAPFCCNGLLDKNNREECLNSLR
jgi:hypothetical protein